MRKHYPDLLDFLLGKHRGNLLKYVAHVEFSSRGGSPILKVFLNNVGVPLEEGGAGRADGAKIYYGLLRQDYLLELPNAVVTDPSHVISY